jgi:hypothetical protein
MPNPDDLLTREQRRKLREQYNRDDANKALSATLTAMYAATTEYIDAIGEAFYEPPTTHDVVAPDNRERCLIALLTARGAGLTLAVHIYLALMEGYKFDRDAGGRDEITPAEVASIIFLSGVYTGSDNLMKGLSTLMKTLQTLAVVADDPDPAKRDEVAVLTLLKAAFPAS